MCAYVSWCVAEGQRTAFGSWFSPSIILVPGIELRLSELVTGTFIFWANSLTCLAFWVRGSPWTWSFRIGLVWLANKLQGPPHSTSIGPCFPTHDTALSFFCGCWESKLKPPSLHSKHFPMSCYAPQLHHLMHQIHVQVDWGHNVCGFLWILGKFPDLESLKVTNWLMSDIGSCILMSDIV